MKDTGSRIDCKLAWESTPQYTVRVINHKAPKVEPRLTIFKQDSSEEGTRSGMPSGVGIASRNPPRHCLRPQHPYKPEAAMEGQALHKYEIALMLARRYGYTSYLEICTPNTGCAFSLVDKQQFRRRARLMYRCPPGFSDGEPVDFSTDAESSEELFGKLVRSGERFDLVFIDPWHSYESSLRDIVFGLQLIKGDGVVLIHDCNPPNPTCAQLEVSPVEWCGVTFAAYLDVVLFTGGIHNVTVDSDYGCGIISKDRRLAHIADSQPDAALAKRWQTLDLSQKYSFFDENRSRLLRLISPHDFRRRLIGETEAAHEEPGSE